MLDTSTAENEKSKTATALGQYLAAIRADRKMTLREVEEATNKQVSNAYLSQIETGKIRKPSPNILHTLAELYGISFENLMERAGYFVHSTKRKDSDRHGRVPTFAEMNLTDKEEAEMIKFLQFLRHKKGADD